MSSNKSIRNKMIKKYGKRCMVEAAGIRYIPISKRRKIKGYRKSQETLTYHHIKERQFGGETTEENGAIIKGYNHAWLHSLSEEEKEEVNKRLQEYKLSVALIGDEGIQAEVLDFDLSDESFEINLLPQTKEIKKKRSKFNRAKEKQEFLRRIRDYEESK